jgi:hypothetical protein
MCINEITTTCISRNGVSRAAKLWPGGRIPYAISPHYNPHERALLARAIKQYHEKTCIRFTPRGIGENDYLFIGKVDGSVGSEKGVKGEGEKKNRRDNVSLFTFTERRKSIITGKTGGGNCTYADERSQSTLLQCFRCFSEVGRTNGVQVLSLDNGCMEYSTIIHEMMHVGM